MARTTVQDRVRLQVNVLDPSDSFLRLGGPMRSVPRALVALVVIPVVTAVGCETPTVAEPSAGGVRLSVTGENGVVLNSSGGGHYFLQNAFDVQFAYTAKLFAN